MNTYTTPESHLRQIMSDLWHQHPQMPSTFSQCSMPGCRHSARGGRVCSECLLKSLERLIGNRELAAEYLDSIRKIRILERDMMSELEGLRDD